MISYNNIKPKLVHVIINPVLSRRIPLLSILNQTFRKENIRWDISVTHEIGDGERIAKEAITKGAEVLAVYGGDGTVLSVASAISGTNIPLLILGGGTGNLLSSELRLSTDVERMCKLICKDKFLTRNIDIGMVGKVPFLLRLSCGLEVDAVRESTREMKQQFGKMAYIFSGMKRLQELPEAKYKITINQENTINTSGVALIVANAGIVGIGKLVFSPSVKINDGQLDVFLLKKANIESILQLASKIIGIDKIEENNEKQFQFDASKLVTHWKVKSMEIESDPILDVQVDGDIIGSTPQKINVLSKSLRVVINQSLRKK